MKATGIIRPVDSMGRIVIPKEIRKILQVQENRDSLEIYVEDDMIILKKHRPTCFLCGKIGECVELNDYIVCTHCIDKLNAIRLASEIENE